MNSFSATSVAELLALRQTAAARSVQRITLAAGVTEFPAELYLFCQSLG